MKIAFQVEDISDEAILAEFIKKIANLSKFESMRLLRRAGGWPAVYNTIKIVSWAAWNEAADVLVIALDNDENAPQHEPSHVGRRNEFALAGCHHCRLTESIPTLPDRAPLEKLKPLIAVPVQALESWLLFGADIVGRRREHSPERLDHSVLKMKLYGGMKIARSERLEIAIPIVQGMNLESLAQNCPSFKHFRDDVLALFPNQP